MLVLVARWLRTCFVPVTPHFMLKILGVTRKSGPGSTECSYRNTLDTNVDTLFGGRTKTSERINLSLT